jgi:hypothetical protein
MARRGVFAKLMRAAAAVVLAGACTETRALPPCESIGRAASALGPAAEAVLVGAGDVAECGDLAGAEATARILDRTPGIVFTLGDNVYEHATLGDFVDCYGPTWGRHRSRTRPAIGNHEYHTARGAPYFAYFCGAGRPFEGWYSYDAGTWHVVVLNSNCDEVGCAAGSEQERWLRRDLAAHPTPCTLAYFHHPRFSSLGQAMAVRPFWQALYEAGADLVLSGHAHNYQRYAPQDANGALDEARGIRQFVVGTGGAELGGVGPRQNNTEAAASVHGVLKLTLHAGRYEWEFLPVEGASFTDRGGGPCH